MTNKLDIATLAEPEMKAALSLPGGFKITEVPVPGGPKPQVTEPPSLGPLAAFTGTFKGSGFNTIFRPDSAKTPTPLPVAPPPPPGGLPSDNILELNVTTETLSFSPSLGAVPNRGTGQQADAFLNGVPYLQSITDVTDPTKPTGIHLEPGLWIIVPTTTLPAEGSTLARMASIPHGTTIEAQGTWTTKPGAPTIPETTITPFLLGKPTSLVTFPSQTASDKATFRIPQDLTSLIASGTITQAILTDPNTVLRNHLAGQKITSTTTISINTTPALPLFGGGTDNIAFLLGDPAAANPNAQSVQMEATFWIETVEHTIVVPVFKPGQAALKLKPTQVGSGPVPTFTVTPPVEITAPRTIVVTATQIQYSQKVFLNFKGLTWPHVSVATLVPSEATGVPTTGW